MVRMVNWATGIEIYIKYTIEWFNFFFLVREMGGHANDDDRVMKDERLCQKSAIVRVWRARNIKQILGIKQ